jgi:hypothetical protein
MTGDVSTRTVEEPIAVPRGGERPSNSSMRRFTWSVVVGALVGAIPFVWVLCDTWTGHLNPLRQEFNANFYDLQAQAIMHGHLYVPPVLVGVEGFRHAGHTFIYFGIFPSLLRIPFLAVDPGLYQQLTAPSMLVAWVVTTLFTALLMWRVRVLVRGTALLTRGEATSFGVLMAAISGGSVLLLLASMPWVYD